jgi:hypothetical protein
VNEIQNGNVAWVSARTASGEVYTNGYNNSGQVMLTATPAGSTIFSYSSLGSGSSLASVGGAVIGETACAVLEPSGGGELVFGGIFLGTAAVIDLYRSFAKGRGNVGDTGVLDDARSMVRNGQAKDICDALRQMYAGPYRNKIKATQKQMGCRAHS